MKRTVILGASPNPQRYSHKAVLALHNNNHEVFPIGIREGKIGEIDIILEKPQIAYVHTFSMYLSIDNQLAYYDYIIKTKPKRIIFNPGSENPELAKLAQEAGITTENACTLVLLRIGAY